MYFSILVRFIFHVEFHRRTPAIYSAKCNNAFIQYCQQSEAILKLLLKINMVHWLDGVKNSLVNELSVKSVLRITESNYTCIFRVVYALYSVFCIIICKVSHVQRHLRFPKKILSASRAIE